MNYICLKDNHIYKKDTIYRLEIISDFGSNIFCRYDIYENDQHIGIVNTLTIFRFFGELH